MKYSEIATVLQAYSEGKEIEYSPRSWFYDDTSYWLTWQEDLDGVTLMRALEMWAFRVKETTNQR